MVDSVYLLHMESAGAQSLFLIRMRNFIFGAEDSLVSTVGLLSGLASAQVATEHIILTGVVLIFVEAFSMAVGSFLSQRATEEYGALREPPIGPSLLAGGTMLFSYFVFGFIPLAPYVFLSPAYAPILSVLASLIALAILGVASARILKSNIIHNTLRMTLMGGVAIALGASVGMLIG